MSKSLHSRHSKIFLKKLRALREERQLRQADLGKLLGRSQGWVSYVECGQTNLDIIELREWLEALNYKFMTFLRELDADLRLESLRLRAKPGDCRSQSALGRLVQGGMALEKAPRRPAPSSKDNSGDARK